jgi:polyphosphate kinase 2 (PPK2 family)
MGFCSKAEHKRFLKVCPEFELHVVDDGILLVKFWLEVSDAEQKRRFEARINDPLRQWKLSPTDLCSRSRWFEYSRARDIMLEATDTEYAPWYIVPSDDKRRARLNCISHLLGLIRYEKLPGKNVQLPGRSMQDGYDDQATLEGRRFVKPRY